MKFNFPKTEPPPGAVMTDWNSWRWQIKNSLQSEGDFSRYFALNLQEKMGFGASKDRFRIQSTPYYARLAQSNLGSDDPIRRILMPQEQELMVGLQQMKDPLGENRNRPVKRVIHRYTDRALFLVTDMCAVYCRYCTRKHFTAQDQVFPSSLEYDEALQYFKDHKEISEVILSGGDPLTLSSTKLNKVLSDLRSIEHIEIIRIGTRVPVVNPFRVDEELVQTIKPFGPIYIMTHFNHPAELTAEAAKAIGQFVDNGLPVFNQMVLLNGVNNHAVIVKALSRRLLYLRAKPYYMFQCDPSQGTDHLRTSIDDSLRIQSELWGRMSGLAMPNLSLDIPGGGGKVPLVPNFEVNRSERGRTYRGWDGVEAEYLNPSRTLEPKGLDQWSDLF